MEVIAIDLYYYNATTWHAVGTEEPGILGTRWMDLLCTLTAGCAQSILACWSEKGGGKVKRPCDLATLALKGYNGSVLQYIYLSLTHCTRCYLHITALLAIM